jgi:hypothetical protein
VLPRQRNAPKILTMKRHIQQFLKSSTRQNIDLYIFGLKTSLSIIWLIVFSIIWIGGGILLLPITTPTYFLLKFTNDRLKCKAADRFSCNRCGNILGDSAIKLAEVEWNKLIIERPLIQKQNSSDRSNAICTNCRCEFTYKKLSRTFILNTTLNN